MNATMETKKKEAISRMKKWGLSPEVIKYFQNKNLVSVSEPPLGACYFVDEELLKYIREFEKEYSGLVYHVIHSYTNFGEMYSYLYVSDYPEEWEYDNEDIKYGSQCCYVYNKSDDVLSEFGSIGIKRSIAAGLERVF